MIVFETTQEQKALTQINNAILILLYLSLIASKLIVIVMDKKQPSKFVFSCSRTKYLQLCLQFCSWRPPPAPIAFMIHKSILDPCIHILALINNCYTILTILFKEINFVALEVELKFKARLVGSRTTNSPTSERNQPLLKVGLAKLISKSTPYN